MYSRLSRRFAIEYSHFLALAPEVRRILLSYAFYLAAFPLVMTFMSAYLWRTSGSLWSIIAYNLAYVIGLPPGFYLNGLLLKRFSAMRIYFLGTLLQGFIPLLLVFIAPDSLVSIFSFGLAYGLGGGLYYGNKNYLSLILTRLTNRVYYNSIEQIIDLVINILIPALTGWFIAWGSAGILGTSPAYQIVMAVGFIFLFFSGLIVQSLNTNPYHINGLFISKSSQSWNQLRLFNILYNTQVGLSLIISSVIILYLVGNEGILGIILVALVTYYFSQSTTLRFVPLIIALLQLPLSALIYVISRTNSK